VKLTQDELSLIRKIVNDTTPGNWVVNPDFPLQVIVEGYKETEEENEQREIHNEAEKLPGGTGEEWGEGLAVCNLASSRDCRFIARSKEWITSLLDEVETNLRPDAIRKALDEALREADGDRNEEDHPWRKPDPDGNSDWCVSHHEGQHCCLDPDHGDYNKLLDYLTNRVARALGQP
jgi:hypothetical protein